MDRTNFKEQQADVVERMRGRRVDAGEGDACSPRPQARGVAGDSHDGSEGESSADDAKGGVAYRRIWILRKRRSMAKTGMSESTFDDTRRRDPSFPKAVQLGARAIGFFEHELDDWLARQPRIHVCRVESDSGAEV